VPSETEKLEIHLRDGGVIFATLDVAGDDISDPDAFIEGVVAGPPAWVWIGDAYVHNRAISGIAYVDEIDLGLAPQGGQAGLSLALVEELATQ